MARLADRRATLNRRNGSSESSPRRQELLRIASEVFVEQGFRNTTVRDIAARAEMLSGSLFYHFRTKDSMAEELVRPIFEEFVDLTRRILMSDEPVDVKITALSRAYAATLEGDNLVRARILFNDWHYLVEAFTFLSAGIVEINRLWMETLADGIASGVLRDDIELPLLFRLVRAVVNDMLRWYDPAGPNSVADVAEASIQVVLGGVLVTR